MKKDIAIIGMAGRFPDADNIDELFENLKEGKHSIGDITDKRIKDTTLDKNGTYKKCGYLEDVDKFDYEFFNLSFAEAVSMSPLQRESLQVAYKTIENAGYNPEDFDGMDVSVYICGPWYSNYVAHADEFNTLIDIGNSPEFLGSKVARELNLLGNCVLVNTACSSSIASMHLAINEIIVKDCEVALVIAGNLELFPTLGYEPETTSKTGLSTSFSDMADGMVYGEGFCGVLLKSLENAQSDKDNIHAIITGWASNNNGNRSSSILATDSKQQCEVYLKAWKKAGITPQQLGFIEAHGSATQLGDCLEVEGLNAAFQKYTSGKQLVPISSIKSNIGHILAAAGMAGLFKAVLALKHKVIFPNINKGELNSNIDFENAAVYVNQECKPWEIPEDKVRLAAVSSFGRGGTNSHMVLQEYLPEEIAINNDNNKDYLLTISGKNEQSLKRNIDNYLKTFTRYSNHDLPNISFTMNCGRPHYDYRVAVVGNDISQIRSKLQALSKAGFQKANAISNQYFVFSDQKVDQAVFTYFQSTNNVFASAVAEFKNVDLASANIRSFIFQYGFYKLINSYNVISKNLVSKGLGGIVKAFILGDITAEEAIQNVLNYKYSSNSALVSKIEKFLSAEAKKPIAMIFMGFKEEFAEIAENLENKNINNFYLSSYHDKQPDIFLEFLARLYERNLNFNGQGFKNNFSGYRLELPTNEFEKTRCWLRDEPKFDSNNNLEEINHSSKLIDNGTDVENLVAACFQDVLNVESLQIEDDFFTLGGDSLKATKLISKIKHEFDIKLDFDDVFDFPSIQTMASFIEKQLTEEMSIARIWKDVLFITNDVKPEDDFFDLGGHSILATKVINRLSTRYAIDLNFDELFFNPTVAQLAELIRSKKSLDNENSHSKQILVYEEQDYYPVSQAQKRMIFAQQIYKSGTSYNATNVFELLGKLDISHLENTFNKLIQRQEILRTSFHFIEQVPYQKINDFATLKIYHKNIEGKFRSKPELDGLITREIEQFVQPFDLSMAPLFKIALITVSEKKTILILDMDHTITDNTSYQIFTSEFMRLFQNELLTPLTVHYKDYAIWQNNFYRSEQFNDKSSYWLNQFSSLPPDLNLPTDYPRTQKTGYQGDEFFLMIDEELAAKLMDMAAKTGVTTYILMLATLKILLYKLTKQEDICVGIPYSQRNNAKLENMLGVLLNTLVLRTYPSPDKKFSEFLEEVRQIAVNAYANSEYPFEMLLEAINYQRKPGRSPLFDILFNSLSADKSLSKSGRPHQEEELQFMPYDLKETSSTFDIYMVMQIIDSNIYLTTTYKTDLFEKPTIKYLLDEYCSLLSQVVEGNELSLKNFKVFENKKAKSKKIQVINTR